MRTAYVFIVAAIMAAQGHAAFGQQSVSIASPQPQTTPRAAQKRIPPVAAFLSQSVDAVDWEDVSFSAVVEWLREQNANINVIVVWRALQMAGIDRDASISLHMRGTTVGQVLEEALDQLSAGFGEVRYQGVGETLKISTRRHFNQKLYVRAYDVADLILATPDFIAPPIGGLTDEPIGVVGPAGEEEGAGGTVAERMDQLVEQIRNVVGPENWAENGGRCTITIFQSNIIVRAPIEVHEILGGPFILPE